MQERWEVDIERKGSSRGRGGVVPVSIAFYGDRRVREGEGGSLDDRALVSTRPAQGFGRAHPVVDLTPGVEHNPQ